MMLSVFSVILFAAGIQAQTTSCGKILPTSINSHIIGSEDVDASRLFYPWHLGLEFQDSGSQWVYTCGAVLIYEQWALTSARCVENATLSYRVVAGDWNRTGIEGTEQWIDVSSITLHPDYVYGDVMSVVENNIAILSLAEPADVINNDYINTACLPPTEGTSYIENPNCFVTGWGVRQVGGNFAPILLRSGIDVIQTQFYCLLNSGDFGVQDNQVCVMDQANRVVSICDGDFGGPLQCMDDATWYLGGIASHVTDPECSPDNPQIYSDVAKYLSWIAEVTKLP